MKRGFTLLELIIVIIIIGILATLGIVQYTQIIEKGRKAEAKSVLGAVRQQAAIWNQEGSHATAFPANADLPTLLGIPSAACNAQYYFVYTINSATGLATATRCTAGGKAPNVPLASVYTLTLAMDGTTVGWD